MLSLLVSQIVHPVPTVVHTRHCWECKEDKPYTEFRYQSPLRKGPAQCRTCMQAKKRIRSALARVKKKAQYK